ncbi:MAG: ABC-F family ATP-binding cassette domain-containing protein [Trueperaceae bacterium]
MELLRADHLYYWQQGNELFKDVSLVLRQGERVGLVGRNGSGKTTLLKILSGELQASDGKISRSPGVRLSYLSQQLKFASGTILEVARTALEDIQALEQKLREEEVRIAGGGDLDDYRKLTEQFETFGGYEAEVQLEKILTLFGFLDTSQNVTTLSGGEKMRLDLVVALVRQPDVLLLDEPTNHLDLHVKRLLATQLKNYRGTLLIASHDRAFLDLVCTHTALLKDTTLTLYKGNYTHMMAQRGLEQRTLQKKVRQADVAVETEITKEIRDIQRWQEQRLAKQRKAEQAFLEAQPKLVIKTEISKETLLTAKHLSVVGARGEASSTAGSIWSSARLHNEMIIPPVEDSFSPLQDGISFRLEAGDKVALLGANGTGKSTLLKLLAGEIESNNPKAEIYFHPDSKVFVYDQTYKAVIADVVLLDQLTSYVSDERAKMLLALVGVPRQYWLSLPNVLSGGERGRLGLAKLIVSEANILLLDEPTNDLDIGLIERLEAALSSSGSAAIFVTHDERFAQNVATRIWSLEHGKLIEYQGGVAGYFKKTQKLEELKIEGERLKVEETDDEKQEQLELERLELEDVLLDSITTSERDYARAKLRLHTVMEELSLLYDKPFPEPLPRYQISEKGVEISGNLQGSHIHLETNADVQLRIKRLDHVAHLGIIEPEESCLLPWVRIALLNCLTRLAFLYVDAKVVQYQFDGDVSDSMLREAGNGWWVLDVQRFETREGYVRQAPSQGNRRRKRRKFHSRRKLKLSNSRTGR